MWFEKEGPTRLVSFDTSLGSSDFTSPLSYHPSAACLMFWTSYDVRDAAVSAMQKNVIVMPQVDSRDHASTSLMPRKLRNQPPTPSPKTDSSEMPAASANGPMAGHCLLTFIPAPSAPIPFHKKLEGTRGRSPLSRTYTGGSGKRHLRIFFLPH